MSDLTVQQSGTPSVIIATQVKDDLGFSRWRFMRLIESDTIISVPYSNIPSDLLPSSESQYAAETSTCSLRAPWGGFQDPYSEFIRGGGFTGTVIGAIGGLANISQLFSQRTTAHYGLGREYTGPQFGYCVGTIFKEKVYTEVHAINVLNAQFLGSSSEDLIFRSKFERFYLHHGIIKIFTTVDIANSKFKIIIDTKAETTSVDEIDFSTINDTITLYKRTDGSSLVFSIDKVKGVNGGIEIDVTFNGAKDTSIVFSSSDFFVLSKSWFIQDPYLLDGLMNNITIESLPTGSQEFFRTDQNTSLSEGSVTGVYIRRKNNAAPGDPIDPGDIDMPSPDSDISLDSSFLWRFYPITSGVNSSEIFKNNDRYLFTQLSGYDKELIPVAVDTDYSDLISNDEVSYLKIEISHGGRSTRTNFHDNGLIGGFLIQNNNYFEILGQEGGHIIDVSIFDISKKIKLDPKSNANYILPNEFGWKAVEWYMTDLKRKFLEGEIVSINSLTNEIVVKVIGESTATTFGQLYWNKGLRDSISFFERFINEYQNDINSSPRRLYSKFKGWYTHGTKGNSYPVVDVTIPSSRVSGEQYLASIQFDELPEEFSIGDTVFTLFDKSPIKKVRSFNGIYSMQVSEIKSPIGTFNNQICLNGFWLSPRFNETIPSGTKFGLCGGRYWGLGDGATKNENAIVFMRTKDQGFFGLSSLYHNLTSENFLLFYDFERKTMSIRRGSLSFVEYPKKYEVSIGLPSSFSVSSVSSSGNSEITLDLNQDRVKLLQIETPIGNEVMLFSLGSIDEYYGTTILGNGKMNLIGFRTSNIIEDPNLFLHNGEKVSPIYKYMMGKECQQKFLEIPIGIATEEGPIIISNPHIGVSINSAKVHYVNNNQIIDNASFFDIHKINDELMILMGRKFSGFTVNNPDNPTTIVSNSGSTAWSTRKGVFIIGSKDTGIHWGNPQQFSGINLNGSDQFGLLILDNVNYLSSIYNNMAREILIFFTSEIDGQIYLGCFIINVFYLNYENFFCYPEGDALEFLWRPPALSGSSYNPNPVEDNFIFDNKKYVFGDSFFVIASANQTTTNSQVELTNVENFEIISSNILSDNIITIFYDSSDGVQMLFSKSSGMSWEKSEIILAKDAKGAIYGNRSLIYITSYGIEAKFVSEELLNLAMQAIEGSEATFIESIQKRFDDQSKTSLNTGPVQLQKLSGHLDDTNIFHVFYYDEDGRICSSQGTPKSWRVNDNF